MQLKLLVPVLIILMVISTISLPVSAAADSNERVIHTQGNGEVITTPDRVEISLAVVTEHADVRTAQRDNANQMSSAMDALKRAGLTSEDMKTTGYSIYTVTKSVDPKTGMRLPAEEQIEVYRVTNTLLVTMKDTARAGEIIDIAVENGANKVNYISFTLSDEKEKALRATALQNAVADSRADADVVAAALGLTVRDVKEVTIGGGFYPVVSRMYDSMMVPAAMERAETPIEPGEVKVTATVSITYLC